MEVVFERLADFISGKKICTIPVYQRNYDWKIEHCEQLFQDLKQIISKNEDHFIGTVVFQEKNVGTFKEQIIIDGQQRITSLILFARAIYDFAEDEQLRDEIYTAFIKNSKYDAEFKLKPSEFDTAAFQKIMAGENFNADEFSRMYLNYKFFKDKIAAKKELLSKFYNALYRIQIVAMKIDKEKPQEIFESLNSTGKDLTETELIRNFLLMDLNPDVQENLYKKYWLPMEQLLKTSETVETFMFQYLVSKKKSSKSMKGDKNIQISKNALYFPFKKYFDKNFYGDKAKAEKVENFLADMYHNAEFYKHLIFDEDTDFENLSTLEKKFYELIYLLKTSATPIILMELNRLYEQNIFGEKVFAEMLDALISLMFRAKICRQTGADTAQNAGNILLRLEKNPPINIDSFWDSITGGNGKYNFPDDEQFKQALLSGELYLSLKDTCRYFLYKLEKNSDFAQNLPRYKDTKIDFIMPKKLNNGWKNYLDTKKDLDNHEIYFSSLGNLILTVEDKKDGATFNDKRVKFATSKFYFTNYLQNYSDWTSKQIRRRAEILANKALKIWILPEKYNQIADTNENIFTLYSEFRNFTGRKPKTVSIFGKEENIRSWRDLMQKVLSSICEIEENIFKSAASDFISTNAANFREPLQIQNNLYIESNLSTQDILKVTKKIIENFDRIGNTNFTDEVWFTLKN